MNRVVGGVEARLEGINPAVEAARSAGLRVAEDLVDVGVVERGPEPAELPFGRGRVGPLRAAGDRQERFLRLHQAEVHRPREGPVEDEEADGVLARHRPILLAVHLQGTGTLEH